jgi:ubiquinone/menaquinone biosynthesis C-methylase UbiE
MIHRETMGSTLLSTSDSYLIRGGIEGRERLRILARVMAPTTLKFLESVPLDRTARCLDVGCGGGDVTVALSRMVPQGHVTGIDFDGSKVLLAQQEARTLGIQNVDFRAEDVTASPQSDERYDLIYVRFVLTHLRDPERALRRFYDQLKPGGTLAVEDIDFGGHICYPPSASFDRYVELYSQSARARGCDPFIGPRLPSLVQAAGYSDVSVGIVQPSGTSGEVKLIAAITFDAIAESVLNSGLETSENIQATSDALYEFSQQQGSFMSIPRVFQCRGIRR